MPKALAGHFLTRAGMTAMLNGEVPEREDDIRRRSSVCAPEPRVRLAIDGDTGTARTGYLFTTEFVRPARDIVLLAGIDGVDATNPPEHMTAAFGGESRWAWLARHRETDLTELLRLPAPPLGAAAGAVPYTVTLLTPAALDLWPRPGEKLAGLPGTIVCAAIERPLRPGGWMSEAGGPQPSEPLLPAGSTWFMLANADEAEAARAWHLRKIGDMTNWGHGQVAIGAWHEPEETQT